MSLQSPDQKSELVLQVRAAGILAQRIRDESPALTRRWLDCINERVGSSRPAAFFRSDDLLNHVRFLSVGVADYLEDPERVVVGEMSVVAKAMGASAELRFAQGFDAYELSKEYEMFG